MNDSQREMLSTVFKLLANEACTTLVKLQARLGQDDCINPHDAADDWARGLAIDAVSQTGRALGYVGGWRAAMARVHDIITEMKSQ